MNLRLPCMLLGAAAGALTGSTGNDRLMRGTLGASLGAAAGTLTQAVAGWLNKSKFDKQLRSAPDASDNDIRKLMSHFKDADLPVYVQTGGADVQNAFYSDAGAPSFLVAGDKPEWTELTTGRKYNDEQEPAVFVGKSYRKLPVIAHELGHAVDMKGRGGFMKRLPMLIGLASLAATGTAMYRSHRMLKNPSADYNPYITVGAALLGIAMSSIPSMITNSWERKASDIAQKRMSEYQRASTAAKSLDMLRRAYSTYDPVQLSAPDFGKGNYSQLA